MNNRKWRRLHIGDFIFCTVRVIGTRNWVDSAQDRDYWRAL
jgi:hypothetical protein